MPKGYWVSAYRTIADPEKLAAYTKSAAHTKLAGPAVRAGGGRSPAAVGSSHTTPESPSVPS